MKWFSAIFVLFIVEAYAKDAIDFHNLDHIRNFLNNEKWDTDEIVCRNKIFNLMDNVKNSTLWATWVWNSMPESTFGIFYGLYNHLGSYDQCLDPPWLDTHPELRTQYCLADIDLEIGGKIKMDLTDPDPYVTTETFLRRETFFGRTYDKLSWGLCLPAGCPAKSGERVMRAMLDTSYLHASRTANITIHHCEVAGAPHEYGKGFFGYLLTYGFLLTTAIISSIFVIYVLSPTSNSFASHVARSFSLTRNWGTLMKEDKDALTCLHGIRFLTAVAIIFIHTSAFLHGTSALNGIEFEKAAFKAIPSFFIIHFDVYVDTFFLMSALLLGKSLPTMDIMKPFYFVKQVAKRYIRLISAFAATVMYLAYVGRHTEKGPLFSKMGKFEFDACEKNWWLSLLMVGNYIKTDEMCHPGTWYIPSDFHFYVITLALLYLYRRNPKAGLVASAVVALIGLIAPAVTTYIHDLYPIMIIRVGNDVNIRKSPAFIKRYIYSHNRMGPYMVGLAFGYIMYKYKPSNYKKAISKAVSVIGAGVSLAVMSSVLIAGIYCLQNMVHGTPGVIYTMFNRITWSLGVGSLIMFCTYGDVPLINSFLSWSAFGPLSRLSYGLYVTHLVVLYRRTGLKTPNYHHFFDMITDTLGLTVLGLILSLNIWLIIEAPLINLTSPYLDTRSAVKQKESENINETQNGLKVNGHKKDH